MGAGSSATDAPVKSIHKKKSKTTINPIIVLVDMDDTIANIEDYFLKKFREKYPYEPYVKCQDRNTHYIDEQYVKLPGASINMRKKVYSILGNKGFFRNMPKIEGAVEALESMNNMKGVEVFLVTFPFNELCGYNNSVPEKYQWVEDHLGVDWIERLILAEDKTQINGDILIDDSVNLTGKNENPSLKQVVFTACHNQNMDIGNLQRLENWKEENWKPLIEEIQRKRQGV